MDRLDTTTDKTRFAFITAIVGGAVIWLAATAIGGRTEAWDSPFYWTAAYPLSICLAGWLGYRAPVKAWRWGWLVMLAQAVTMAFTASGFGLLPLGLILFSILALPAAAVAGVTARIRLLK